MKSIIAGFKRFLYEDLPLEQVGLYYHLDDHWEINDNLLEFSAT